MRKTELLVADVKTQQKSHQKISVPIGSEAPLLAFKLKAGKMPRPESKLPSNYQSLKSKDRNFMKYLLPEQNEEKAETFVISTNYNVPQASSVVRLLARSFGWRLDDSSRAVLRDKPPLPSILWQPLDPTEMNCWRALNVILLKHTFANTQGYSTCILDHLHIYFSSDILKSIHRQNPGNSSAHLFVSEMRKPPNM